MRQRAGLVWLVIALPFTLSAQEVPRPWHRPAGDSATVLLVEHQFAAETGDSVILPLKKSGYYWAELEGAEGTLTVRPTVRGRWEALVVPLGPVGSSGGEVLEVHPGTTGPHALLVTGLRLGSRATLRLYSNEAESHALALRAERSWGIGVGLSAGFHSGYRLDPTGGADPGGGGDYEGCIIIESAVGLGGCLGIGKQHLPDAGLSVTWYFIEPRVRLLSRQVVRSSRTDLGVSLRLSQGGETGPRSISPSQIAGGVYITQHLVDHGRTRGLSLHLAYHHGKLGHVPETEDRDTDRIVGGITWVP